MLQVGREMSFAAVLEKLGDLLVRVCVVGERIAGRRFEGLTEALDLAGFLEGE